jgi:hypothetical protein
MGTPASATPADQPGLRSAWLVLTASERGASHLATQVPNQDSVESERAGVDGMVAAVADGHGHARHLRSARGSKLAVRIGCQVAQELADRLEGNGVISTGPGGRANLQPADPPSASAAADAISGELEEFLVPQIIARWRKAVLADVAADPFTDAEDEQRQKGDDPTVAYGSTLLLGVALHDWLILAQIGDGDVVGVRADGRAILPVPADPQLDGLVTTSLCGPDAQSDFRMAIVDTSKIQLAAVLLATDGYGNAQLIEEWPSAFSQDLARMLKEHDMVWLASQLPSWAARCASADGSADDTTVALLVSRAAAPHQTAFRPAVEPDIGSEETTIPAAPHGDTVPNNLAPGSQQSGRHSIEPITARLPPVPADESGASAAGTGEPTGQDDPSGSPDAPTAEWEPPGAGSR